MALAVAEKDDIGQRPVAAFGEDDIEVAIAVEVPQAGVGGSFGNGFERRRLLECS
jgi:hypothetical protein